MAAPPPMNLDAPDAEPLSLAAVAAAAAINPAADAHADDSYCALCRRCQMRKKLERRLAARKCGDVYDGDDAAMGAVAVGAFLEGRIGAGVGAGGGGRPGREEGDHRSLDELLEFIDGPEAQGKGSGVRKGRRKRAAAAALRKRAASLQAEGAVAVEVPRQGHASDAAHVGHESPVSDDEAVLRATSISHQLFALSTTDSTISDGDAHNAHSYDHSQDHEHEEMTPEEEEAIDREVEEFRRLLESAYIHHSPEHRRCMSTGTTRLT